MKHQVSSADYQRCVEDGACRALDRGVVVAPDRPAVQVSWHDADAYAAWLSRKTGEHYRLPTDDEWAFAAGSHFRDDGMPVDENDPSKRWLARYEREVEIATAGRPTASRSRSAASAPTRMVCSISAAMSGNGPTPASCVRRSTTPAARCRRTPNCGVRVVEGQHRSYVTDFIRDARAGGCAVGLPPSNLGFRLVREPRAHIPLIVRALLWHPLARQTSSP